MANCIIDAEERALLDASLTGSLTLHLYTTAVAPDGTGGVEVTGGSYAAQTIMLAAAATVGNDTTKKNSAEVVFPTATASWGTIKGVAIKRSGTIVWRSDPALFTQFSVDPPVQVRYAVGEIAAGIG
ncbi:phage tail fiber protein [Patulibacter defluvii]|uniref:phage tail fiber protein n=1 Tax=Patulibacter defluvii TaxID=3095358 RepID=UPI002A7624CE|nr:hypothetical protein [Patulibacter sp. DM4]